MKINEDYVVNWKFEHCRNILTIEVIDPDGELFDYIQEKTNDKKHRMRNADKLFSGYCLCNICKKQNDNKCLKYCT